MNAEKNLTMAIWKGFKISVFIFKTNLITNEKIYNYEYFYF